MKDPQVLKFESFLRNPLLLIALLVFGGAATVVLVWLLESWSPVQWFLSQQLWFSVLVMAAVIGLMMGACAYCILAERKVSAYIQDRHGPNRTGWKGAFQPVADGLKMFLKEDIIPANIDKPLFLLAPAIAFTVALIGFAIIPWAGEVRWPWMADDAPAITTQVASIDIGFLYLIAVGSMGVYGIVLAGYAANNKYTFYGGIRAAAQMISYEIPLGLGLLCVLLTAESMRLEEIVNGQAKDGLWLVVYQPLAFMLVLVSAFAETNRAPFDLAEAEQELVGGFHTEYSALKFGLFFLGEYAHMITNSALMVALFFGGWHFWGLTADNHTWWAMLIKFGVYAAKIAAFIWFYMVIRWTLPRLRFDQLMRVAWKSMVPIGMGLVIATSVLVLLDLHTKWYCSLAANVLVLIIALAWSACSKVPVTGRQENLPDVKVRPQT
ncbi:MAG: NADH-quinone oxidoreductase subunit NuoH [Planctomycetota bacterium]